MSDSRNDIMLDRSDAATRREFLRTGCTAAMVLAGLAPARAQVEPFGRPSLSAPESATEKRSKVFRVSSHRLISGRIVQPLLLREALEVGLCGLTDLQNPHDAWHRVLKPEDVILLKFNQSGASVIGTSTPLAGVLVDSLLDAGWRPEQIIVVETETPRDVSYKTKRPDMRWQAEEVSFGANGKDAFLAALDEATAIVNVPFLKTHHLATMTCGLKNLSHGLIRHPARFHANGCSDAIAAIVASKPIRSKLRLTIVDAIRPVFDRGPEAREADLHESGALLFSDDTVASDTVGFGILNSIRALHQLPPLLPEARIPRYLTNASMHGLGVADVDKVDFVSAMI